ncbi:MAG TPA: hypothetical protein VFG20_16150 [Planctomycetaceae bacterium]|nr:hypothetical protein [Planctomycetaceae bacterium]
MTTSTFPAVPWHSRSQRVGMGFCLLLAGWLLAPKTVAASCGDYLAHPQHPMALHRVATEDRDTPAPVRPCNGPSCRRSDAPTPAPVPAPLRLIGERWATVLDLEIVSPANASFLARASEELCLSALPARLDRPPKAA